MIDSTNVDATIAISAPSIASRNDRDPTIMVRYETVFSDRYQILMTDRLDLGTELPMKAH